VQGDHFVYNLGTIFFVDSLLSDDLEELKALTQIPQPTEPAKEVDDTTELLSPVYIEEVSTDVLSNSTDILLEEVNNDLTTATATEEANTESNAIPALPSEP